MAAIDEFREHSRRVPGRPYRVDQVPHTAPVSVRDDTPSTYVDALTAAGQMGSALRRRLRARGIDPKLARLVLLLYGWRQICVSDIAWRLNVSIATASRHLDRAERAALIDKFYDSYDRRRTCARLTKRGYALRTEVEALLTSRPRFERPAGFAYGYRSCERWDTEG